MHLTKPLFVQIFPNGFSTNCFVLYLSTPWLVTLFYSLGPACSDTIEPIAGVSKHFRTVVISYGAEGSIASDGFKYPYFFRTIAENKEYK